MDYENKLKEAIKNIKELDGEAIRRAQERMDSLAKPPGSLGQLEAIAVRIAGMTGEVVNTIDKTRVIVLSADNGVVAEGVASSPQSVTLAQTINFTRGLTGVAVIAKHFGSELQVVDMGVNTDFSIPGALDKKIAPGTKNIAHEPAMTRLEAQRAVFTGVELARQAKSEGVKLLGVGEMGIGNTTTSAALFSALSGLPAETTVGRGGGVDDRGFARKKEIVDCAVSNYISKDDDVVDMIAKVSGFDIAAMTGVFLGAAESRLPVVVDGYISIVAALAAVRIRPETRNFLILSHVSKEPGYLYAAKELCLTPMLHLDMRLGEGSGCPLAFSIVSAACDVMKNMATFEEAGISDDYLANIRKNKRYLGIEED
jgi:nicotinate-nucleotide--dimethylbenzimidazole phosphoribosyltransferase